jgi:hypothetical protein
LSDKEEPTVLTKRTEHKPNLPVDVQQSVAMDEDSFGDSSVAGSGKDADVIGALSGDQTVSLAPPVMQMN